MFTVPLWVSLVASWAWCWWVKGSMYIARLVWSCWSAWPGKNGILIVGLPTNCATMTLSLKKAIIDASARRLHPNLIDDVYHTGRCYPVGDLATGFGRAGGPSGSGYGYLLRHRLRDAVTLFVIPAMYRLISGSTRSPGHVEAVLNKELSHDNIGRTSHG